MLCYNCGNALNQGDVCPVCGARIAEYRKIIYASNYFYNDGLSRASVRDLSGAVDSLRRSINFYKYNIDARNLLGLVYYEMGETVAALSEWVISTNIRPKDNTAARYVSEVQHARNQLEILKQSITRYNKALEYCNQGSLDLAVVQLKRVLQMNPRHLRARQLLSLLYIQGGEYAKARRELDKCRTVDVNNTTTLRYLQEVTRQILPEEAGAVKAEEHEEPRVLKYSDGNETIIQPAGARSPMLDRSPVFAGVLWGLIGAALGAALIGFFVMPARVQSVRRTAAAEIAAVSEELDSRSAKVNALEQEKDGLSETNEALTAAMAGFEETRRAEAEADDALFAAAAAYAADPDAIESIAGAFSAISDDGETGRSEAYMDLYGELLSKVRPQLFAYYSEKGNEAYEAEEYEKASGYYSDAVRYGDEEEDGEAYTEAGARLAELTHMN